METNNGTNSTRQLRSNLTPGSTEWAVRRAQWVSLGLTDDDMLKPKIAIVDTSSELSSCFSHLSKLVPVIKNRLREVGAIGFRIGTVAPSDFITSAGRAGRYLMPARDLIVNDIEVAVEGAQLDGMILLSSCDKTTPAHLMAAGRLDIPSIIIPCGYQRHGMLDGAPVDIEDVFESVGAVADGQLSQGRLREMTDKAICSPGVCAGMGTANTMQICAEALGMAASGSSPLPAMSEKMEHSTIRSVDLLVAAVDRGLTPRRIITRRSLRNALITGLALGGSVNMVRHLQAVAVETGLDVSMYDILQEVQDAVPVLFHVRPGGKRRMEELTDAGGTAAVMQRLLTLLDGDVETMEGVSLATVLGRLPCASRSAIAPLENPEKPAPSLVLMKGQICPDGGLMKVSAAATNVHVGPARVFESQEDALTALGKGIIQAGDVCVLRGLGPVGGPGVASASWFTAAVNGSSLKGKIGIITDGQLSGLNSGMVVGQVSPEARAGGPIGAIQDGDILRIDASARRVDWEERSSMHDEPAELVEANVPLESGWLGMYRRLVTPISSGATLRR